MVDQTAGKWPKSFPSLTAEQQAVSDDFVKYWHEVLPRRFGMVEAFNHGYPARTARKNFRRSLEIGAGLGEHLEFETLTPEQAANYYAVDIRTNMVDGLRQRHPEVNAIVGDCQQKLDFPDGYFDRILAIHVLEHLANLPAAVHEIFRLCDKSIGLLQVLIPCEGSPAYTLARRISAQRIFERRYNQSYKWFIEREHVNLPEEIIGELSRFFEIESKAFFPIPLPLQWCNLVIGMNLHPKKRV
jgi:ubiquinone/menaquinone biosynthesis C-methylase UbiE